MTKHIVLLAACSLAAVLLGLTACAPSATSTSQATTSSVSAAPPTTTQQSLPANTTAAEEPQYGGTINVLSPRNINIFDEVVGWPAPAVTMQLTNQKLVQGDWAKGPAGTDASDWIQYVDVWANDTGYIAESWEITGPGTITYKIRQGIHWALNPDSEASRLVNGRELTADDVVSSLKMYCTDPRAYLYRSSTTFQQAQITEPDKWTVAVNVPTTGMAEAINRFNDFAHIVPPEVVQKYGDMHDWHVSEGTGPFMLTDFVDGSSATLVRNPNFWMKDPVGPGEGNQLPYLDGVHILIITDASTQFAALRTGKIDEMDNVGWEDAASLKNTTPDLQSKKFLGDVFPTYMRTDKAPFSDIRVRQALMMATDFNTIVQTYYGGDAQILTWPITPAREYHDAYLGLDDPEMPASVKALYTYDPDQAKELLKEAGYPDGFKTDVIFPSNPTSDADYFSIIKQMWAKVGVDLELKPLESGAYTSIYMARNYDGLLYASAAPVSQLYSCVNYWGKAQTNGSYVDDPNVGPARDQMELDVGQGKIDEANKVHKDLMKYVLAQAWVIPNPEPAAYQFWWPWVKNYDGERTVGYFDADWETWVWLDQGLKSSMTGKK